MNITTTDIYDELLSNKMDYYDEFSHICADMCSKYNVIDGCGKLHHICAFINTKDHKIYMGENSSRQKAGLPTTIHAEMCVLNKIIKAKSLCPSKRINKYDVLVIRVAKNNKLGSSRPCYHCIMSMMKNSFVKIRNVYYSTNDGTIVREKLSEMLKSKLTCVSTGWRRRTRMARYPSGSSSISDYSSSDESSDTSSVHSSRSSESCSHGIKYKSPDIYPDERIVFIINSTTGERIPIPEKTYYKMATIKTK